MILFFGKYLKIDFFTSFSRKNHKFFKIIIREYIFILAYTGTKNIYYKNICEKTFFGPKTTQKKKFMFFWTFFLKNKILSNRKNPTMKIFTKVQFRCFIATFYECSWSYLNVRGKTAKMNDHFFRNHFFLVFLLVIFVVSSLYIFSGFSIL